MSLWDKLPVDIVQHIYEYDTTYTEKLNESLKLIEHAAPTCCCDGGQKNRFRHHYEIEHFGVPFWNWEWRRRNACPKHNPGDFDKDGNQTRFDWSVGDFWEDNIPDLNDNVTHGFTITTTYNYVMFHNTIESRWEREMRNFWIHFMRGPIIQSRQTSKHYNFKYPSPIKTYSRKKLSGARFMDMTHDQRPIAA